MKLPARFLPLLGLALVALPARDAWPCSLAPGVDGPVLRGPVGPNPLLFTAEATAELSTELGAPLSVQAVPGPDPLAGARDIAGRPLAYFRTSEPLAEGTYRWAGAPFTVSSSASDAVPRVGDRGHLELVLGSPDNEVCGDVSLLLIDLLELRADEAPEALFLVRFERSGGASFSRLVNLSERFEATPRLRFFHGFAETGHLSREKLCVQIAGVSAAGEVGAPLALGCVDPNDEDDPRVSRAEGAGCTTTGGRGEISGLWLLGGLLGAQLLLGSTTRNSKGRRAGSSSSERATRL